MDGQLSGRAEKKFYGAKATSAGKHLCTKICEGLYFNEIQITTTNSSVPDKLAEIHVKGS